MISEDVRGAAQIQLAVTVTVVLPRFPFSEKGQNETKPLIRLPHFSQIIRTPFSACLLDLLVILSDAKK